MQKNLKYWTIRFHFIEHKFYKMRIRILLFYELENIAFWIFKKLRIIKFLQISHPTFIFSKNFQISHQLICCSKTVKYRIPLAHTNINKYFLMTLLNLIMMMIQVFQKPQKKNKRTRRRIDQEKTQAKINKLLKKRRKLIKIWTKESKNQK